MVVDRFLRYLRVNTTSDAHSHTTPSTPGQYRFAQILAEELKAIGLSEVTLSPHGYLMATLPSTCNKEVPTLGFIAHMDTSPDLTADGVNPRIVAAYDGGDIPLSPDGEIHLSPSEFPELREYIGQELIVTDGTTLLGADDKAGIAEIITAMEYLLAHPEITHGKIRIAFTPDEEIGQGDKEFDVTTFGADWAYTVDGGAIGELEYENFNAAEAIITLQGRNVHPGYARHKMINAIHIAHEFIAMLPGNERPEHTQGYEGFFHITDLTGSVEQSRITCLIRDHDATRFATRKEQLRDLVKEINDRYPHAASITINDQYYNMREKITPVMHIVELAKEAMEAVGVTPHIQPIRGGTDGARLSFRGLPCPNLFAGGHNFHGRYEFIPIPSMHKAVEVIIAICQKAAPPCHQR